MKIVLSCAAMKAEWIKSQMSKMAGLWCRGVFQKVLRSSLTPQDRVFKRRLDGGIAVSDAPLIDHLVMREFVSGPPSYRSIHKRVHDRKPSLREGS